VVKIKVKKDNMAVIVPILLILLLGVVMANFDKIFPTPDVTGKMSELMQRTNMTKTDSFYGTNPNASVTILEFSDFECPACTMAVPEVHKLIEHYGDKINFVYKHFPAHKDSQKAAEAAECARDQDKFWSYHDMLFENSHSLSTRDLEKYAQSLNLDINVFNTCLASRIKQAKVEADFKEGLNYHIEGTPTFFINGFQLTGVRSFEEMKQIVDSELEK